MRSISTDVPDEQIIHHLRAIEMSTFDDVIDR